MQVYRAICEREPVENDASSGQPQIHIIMKNGWVTLEGAVDSDAIRSQAKFARLESDPARFRQLRVAQGE